jgi:hypothetical protein
VHVLQSSLPGHPRPRREHQPARARGHGRGSARRSRARAAQRVSRPNFHAIAASPQGMMAHLPPELPGAAGQRMLIHRSARPGPQPSLELGRRDRHLMRLSGRAQRAPGPTREPAPTPPARSVRPARAGRQAEPGDHRTRHPTGIALRDRHSVWQVARRGLDLCSLERSLG